MEINFFIRKLFARHLFSAIFLVSVFLSSCGIKSDPVPPQKKKPTSAQAKGLRK